MKRLILSIVCALCLCGLSSAANYLHVKTANGWQVFDLDKVDRLTFDGTTMKATDASGNTVATLPQKSLESISVNESAGIGAITADGAEATFSYDAASRTVTVLADGTFEIYGVDGVRLVAIPASKGEIISLGDLRPGATVFKSGAYTIKAIVK